MLYETVRTSDGLCISLGEVVDAPIGATFKKGVEVRLPDGSITMFALTEADAIGHRLCVGDHVVVRYLPADQFASVISLRSIVRDMGYEVE